MKATAAILARVQAEIDAGRPWRAKEILAGNIGAGRVEPEILEAYGRLLDSLGDRVEAGKYLYLSGARAPQHESAITEFRRRTGRRRGADFAARLPGSVRRQVFETLPPALQQDLADAGVTPAAWNRARERAQPRAEPARRHPILIAAIALMFVVLLTSATLLGLVRIASWAWRMLR